MINKGLPAKLKQESSGILK